jgi:hypothetical protein
MPLANEPLPEINDNLPASTPAPETPAFSLDAVINENIKAPDFKIVEDKVIRSEQQDPALQNNSDEEEEDESEDNDPQDKSQQDSKKPNESSKDKKGLASKDKNKDTDEDDESGETESTESKEEDEQGDKTSEEKSSAEEESLKLHGNTKRDYSGLNQKQIKILKKLDNSRFQAVSTEWRALQSAAMKSVELVQQLEEQKKIAAGKGIPQTWYEHPEAYTLTPEFRQLSNQYSQYDTVEQHYSAQIAAIQDGKPWTAITGFNPQTGEPIYSAPQEPNPQAFANVNRALMQATQAKGQLQGKVDSLQSSFVNNHKQAEQQINQEIQSHLEKLHPEVKPVEGDVKMVMDLLPAMYKSHPLAKGFSQMLAMNFAQARFLKKLLTEKEQGAKIAADSKLAGPRGSNKLPKAGPASGGAKGKNVLSLDYLLQENN